MSWRQEMNNMNIRWHTYGERGQFLLEVPDFRSQFHQNGSFALGMRHVQPLQLLMHVLLDEILLFCLTHRLHHLEERVLHLADRTHMICMKGDLTLKRMKG